MKQKILVVIDMQQDFINGALGSLESQAIIPNVVNKIKEYKENDSLIVTTQDTHYSDYLDTLEGKKLPIIHCVANSDGWQLDKKIFDELRYYKNKMNFTKSTFGSYKIIEFLKTIINDKNAKEFEIELVGLKLDICVISNALSLRMYFPNMKILVDSNCTAATSKVAFNSALEVLNSCQVNVL